MAKRKKRNQKNKKKRGPNGISINDYWPSDKKEDEEEIKEQVSSCVSK